MTEEFRGWSYPISTKEDPLPSSWRAWQPRGTRQPTQREGACAAGPYLRHLSRGDVPWPCTGSSGGAGGCGTGGGGAAAGLSTAVNKSSTSLPPSSRRHDHKDSTVKRPPEPEPSECYFHQQKNENTNTWDFIQLAENCS